MSESGSDRLVTDLPIWTDCPYRIPNGIEVRRGKFADEPEVIVLWRPRTQRHVDFDSSYLTASSFRVGANLLMGKGYT